MPPDILVQLPIILAISLLRLGVTTSSKKIQSNTSLSQVEASLSWK